MTTTPALPDETAAVEREAAAAAGLRAVVAQSGDPTLWALAPKFAIASTGIDTNPGRTGMTALLAAAAQARFRPGPRVAVHDGIAFVSTSAGQRRTLQPVLDVLRGDRAVATTGLPPASASDVRACWAAAGRSATLVTDWLSDHAVTVDEDPRAAILAASLALARAARWITRAGPRCIVVATQQNATVRAILHAARASAVPTVYVPHAPAADVPWYRDLPFDRALLRGPGETEFYAQIGAAVRQLAVVGDPSVPTSSRAGADVRRDAPVVWATSPHPASTLRAIIAIIEAALGTVEVAPHPRSDRTELRSLCPPAWPWITEATTSERLTSRPIRGIVQHRSGMGLEALLADVPVHELCAPGRRPPYLYLQDLGMPTITNAAELARSVAASPESGSMRKAAAHWCAATGPAAVGAVIEYLQSSAVAPAPALDGWGSDPLSQ